MSVGLSRILWHMHELYFLGTLMDRVGTGTHIRSTLSESTEWILLMQVCKC